MTRGSAGPTARWTDLAVLGAYLLLAMLFTWPIAVNFTSSIVGGGGDGWQETWEMWWMDRAIQTGTPPYHFATLYAPTGATNYLHSFNPIEIILTLPVQWVAGPIASYNTACLLALVMTAFGTYLLCRDVSGSRYAGFAGGLVLGFAPHQFGQLLGHMDVASIQFFVLGVWCLYRSFEARGQRVWVWLLWSAVCVAASVLSHPYALIRAIVVMLLMGLYWSFKHRNEAGGWRPLAGTFLAIVIGLAVVSPLLYAMAGQLTGPDAPRRRDVPAEIEAERQIFSADLMAYLIPSPFNPIWRQASMDAQRTITGGYAEQIVFPGYVALALGVVSLLARSTRRRAIFWGLVAVVGFLLSLGPVLRVWGSNTGIPMPAALFYLLPGSFMVRVPSRLSIILMLGLAVCVALGIKAIKGSSLPHIRKQALLLIFPLLIGFEFFPGPYPLGSFESGRFKVEPWHERVASGKLQEAAVLHVPFEPGDAQPLMWQLASSFPVAGGYLSREPVNALTGGVPPFTEVSLNMRYKPPFFDRARDTLCMPRPQESDYLDIMRLAKVRYVLLHTSQLQPDDPRRNVVERLFSVPPIYQSDTLEVYDTGGGEAPPDLLGAVEDVMEWFPVEEGRFRWALGTNSNHIHLWSGSEREFRLQFKLRSLGQDRQVIVSAGGRELAQERLIAGQEIPFHLEWRLPRGFTTLLIQVSGKGIIPASLGQGQDNRPLTISLSECSYSAK
jgi:hypothetical protein